MSGQDFHSSSHAVVMLRLPVVLVTKYRRKVITPLMLADLREVFAEILAGWRCSLLEFGGEADPVHRLVDIHPTLQISVLMNNLKTASSRRMRAKYADRLRRFYWKPFFWHRAYSVGSVGHAGLETVKQYVESQGLSRPGTKTSTKR